MPIVRLKAMDCIAKNAERDDVRGLFRIEVRECFLEMYQRHLARADFFGAQDPTLRYRCTMHTATVFDAARYRRLLYRTIIA